MKTVVPQHINWSRQKAGLMVDTDLPFIGASVDSITNCECHGKRVVEVKCPYSFRDKTLQDFLTCKIAVLRGINLVNHKYCTQMQMYVYDVSRVSRC